MREGRCHQRPAPPSAVRLRPGDHRSAARRRRGWSRSTGGDPAERNRPGSTADRRAHAAPV